MRRGVLGITIYDIKFVSVTSRQSALETFILYIVLRVLANESSKKENVNIERDDSYYSQHPI